MHTALWRHHPGRTPQHPPPAAPPCGAARLWLVLDRRRRMGEGSAAGGPWGDGLRKGDREGGGADLNLALDDEWENLAREMLS